MFCHRITGLRFQKSLLLPNILLAHTTTCPTNRARHLCPDQKKSKKAVCPGSKGGSKSTKTPSLCGDFKVSKSGGSGSGSASSSTKIPGLRRAERSGPVRYGFLPEEWFVFFYPHTGVSGSYVFGGVLLNYLFSKEIYVMEHEYYLGLSIAVVTYYATTTFGPSIAKSLDEDVNAIQKEWEKGRQDQKDVFQKAIKSAKDAQTRAMGQKLLMAAKKENIVMQLEAEYRERMMQVYKATKGRLDYQLKKHMAITKIHQKWMVEWILSSVRRAITPEFEKQALNAAISDLSAAAGKS